MQGSSDMLRHSGPPHHVMGHPNPVDFPTFPSSLPAAFWDGGHNAILVLPKPSQKALCILHAMGYLPVVWREGPSFFLPAAETFVPSDETFYFFIRPSQSVRDEWYVWAPMHHRKRVRVNGQYIGDGQKLVRDADVISVRPPKRREETYSISLFVPSSFLYEYTPKETLKCAAVSRTYACSPAGQGVLPTRRAVKIIRLSSFPSYWSFKDNVRRECRVVDFLMTQSSHPHIVKFFDILHSHVSTYIVAEYPDQHLETIINEKRKHNGTLDMRKTRKYTLGICSAVRYLHESGIVLQNLSTRNIIICRGIPKLSDFTVASWLPLGTEDVMGLVSKENFAFLAPEVLENVDQNEKADCWSVGMVIKNILLGVLGEYGFVEDELRSKNLPESTIDLVSCLLESRPHNRPSMEDVLMHAWFHE